MHLSLRRALLAAMLAAVVAAFAVLGIDTTQPDPARSPTVTVELGPIAKANPELPDQLRVPAAAIADVARSQADDHDEERNENPPGVTPQALEDGREQQERLAALDQLPVVVPDAAPVQAGCRSRFIPSYSSRRGVAPRLFVLHYTVSPNRPGWSDVDGITGYFARPSTNASSNYVIDAEGNCNYLVREADKAWTQAALNPVSISVEIINTGREPTLIGAAGGPGLRQLARVARDATRRWGIPLRRGRVSGASVATSGIVAHKDLGAAGGGHVDISPYNVDKVIAAARALNQPAPRRLNAKQRRWCSLLQGYRARTRRENPSRETERKAVRRRQLLARNNAPCPRK